MGEPEKKTNIPSAKETLISTKDAGKMPFLPFNSPSNLVEENGRGKRIGWKRGWISKRREREGEKRKETVNSAPVVINLS